MSSTSKSLLLRAADSDPSSLDRIVSLYTPLIRGWLRRRAQLQDHDAEDLVQEVLAHVLRGLHQFKHSGRKGAFRAWLRQITVNSLRDWWRGRHLRPRATGDSDFQQMLSELEDPNSGLSRLWDEEHDQHIGKRLLELVQARVEPKTWQVFCAVTLEEQSPVEVAARLGMSREAVDQAKSRVLRLLREEAEGLEDLMD